MFFFVKVVSVRNFLSNLFVHFCKINEKTKYHRQILILKSVNCFTDTVLVCHKVALLEIDLLLYNVLKRVEHLFLDL